MNGLSLDLVEEFVEVANKFKNEDEQLLNMINLMRESDEYVYETREKLKTLKEKLTKAVVEEVEEKIGKVGLLQEEREFKKLVEEYKALQETVERLVIHEKI